MAHILVVDDEPRIRDTVARLLTRDRHRVSTAASGEDAVEIFARDPADVTILDVTLPGINGLQVLSRLRERASDAVVIFMTAFASVRSAVDAMKAGGFDYLAKPFDNDDLLLTVNRALKMQALTRRVVHLEEDLEARAQFPSIIGKSAALQQVLRNLAKVAKSATTVLLTGESGTGKELAARSLHRQSPRASGPFVPINCAAIPATLAESELFGFEKGAFTDAREARAGKWEDAHGGTIFLDEVGELPIDLQAKLLRVIQEREVVRVGGRKTIPVDVRIVAATNRNLEDAVKAGQFRDDLFWRLNAFPIELPPLRERREDVPLLIDHFIDSFNTELGLSVDGASEAAMARLAAHAWPGNIREMANVIRRAMIVTDSTTIEPDALLLTKRAAPEASSEDAVADTGPLPEVVARAIDRIERAMINQALNECRGNRSAAAQRLGIDRRTLFTKMQKLRITTDAEDGG